jgi:hypothetical protein
MIQAASCPALAQDARRGTHVSQWEIKSDGEGWATRLLYHGGQNSIEFWKQWADANQQYERDVQFCETQ